jgi:4-hydroxybenzoyl-CoA thioesterase
MFVNIRERTIEWGECEPAGIVWNPRFFERFDNATAGLFVAALGMQKAEMMRRYAMAGIPLVETRATFHAPCRFGDAVRIESSITSFRRSSFEVAHRLFRGDTLAVEGWETRVWVVRDPEDSERIQGAAIPPDVIRMFE